MMDPLSMTASILAILKLTSSLTSYVNDVRHATGEQKRMAVEASNFNSLLTSLRFRVEEARADEPWFNQVKLLGIENGPLDQFKDALENMVEQMPSSRKRDQVRSTLTWKFTKVEVENTLRRMERLKSLVQCALTEDVFTLSQAIHEDVVTLGNQMDQLHVHTERLQTHANQELLHRLAQWLAVPDPSTNYQAAFEKRHPQTGLWLVSGSQFDNWRSSESSLMWLHGNAGCGKTVLSAAALQTILKCHESRSDTAVSYFYFDFNDVDKQSSKKAIRSLLFQFARQVRHGLQGLEQMYQRCASGQQQPAEDVIQSLLQDTMNRIESKYIIFDALDECTDREQLLTFISNLVIAKPKGLCIMATSRRERDIEEQLRPITDYNINIQDAVVDKDIEVYVQNRLINDPKLKKWSVSVQDEITTVIMEKANGMFRWVYCQLESIRHCIKLKALREALSSLPKTLDETYERILQGLESEGQLSDAIKVLQWLCYAGRPLRLSEMVDILAIENGDEGGFFPEERLPDPADIMVVCSSLINCNAIDDSDDEDDSNSDENLLGDTDTTEANLVQIRLAHFSVKEYLLSTRCTLRSDFQTSICHQQITEGCLRYLLSLSELAPLTHEIVYQHPLAQYTAKYWWQHAQNLGPVEFGAALDLAARLLTANSAALLSWVQLYNINSTWQQRVNLSLTFDDLKGPLYYAASAGVSEVVKKILPPTTNINAQEGVRGNSKQGVVSDALHTASCCGHEKVVKILLDAGAKVDAHGGFYGNTLHAASECGYEKVVQVLPDAGAEVNAQLPNYGKALQSASERGFEKVVQILLDAGADVNAQGGGYGNALQAASENGYEKVVQILLDAGAKVNAQGGYHSNALQSASERGFEKVVQILLDAGADVNTQGGGEYGNALQAASIEGHEKIVQILLDAGADVNTQGGGEYGNALQAASIKGHEKIVQILLDAGAKVNTQGGFYGNALYAASENSREKVVQILLDAGAKVNAQGGCHGNPLQAASQCGHQGVVQILLDAGAEVNAQGGYYGNALQAASQCGHQGVVQMLLDAGAEVNAQGGHYGNALQAASAAYYSHEKVVQILLDAGAEANAQGGCHGNALQAASQCGHQGVVQMLLDAGAGAEDDGWETERSDISSDTE